MMNTKRLLSLLLLGSFIFNNSMVATWSREMYDTFGVTKPQFAKASKEKQEAWITQLSASKSRRGGENLGGNQGGNQVVTPPPVNDPVEEPGEDVTSQFAAKMARVNSPELAVALALEILEYLTKDDNLQFKGYNIDSQTYWSNFQNSVNNNKSEIYGNKWQLNQRREIVKAN
jgi:hypothetical protein